MGFDSNRRKRLLPVPKVKVEGGRDGDREQDQEVNELQENSEACSTNILQIGIQTNMSQDDG